MTYEEILGKFRWGGYDLPEDCAERMGAHGFTDYALYQSPERNIREFYFSCCGHRAEISRRKRDAGYNADLAAVEHGKMVICPFCGQPTIAKHIGRLRGGDEGDFRSLREGRNVAILDACGDMLLISTGRIYRRWSPGESIFSGWPGVRELERPWPEAETWFIPWRRYALKPGEVHAWRKKEIWEHTCQVGHYWDPVKRPGPRPFPAASIMNRDPEDGQYTTVGVEALPKTALKYCAIDKYMAEKSYGGEWEDGVYGWDVVGYLLEAARHPQVEMLTKLGHIDVVEDLIWRKAHRQTLNWRAKRPNEFFRMTKTEYKAFREAHGTLAELEQWQSAKQYGVTLTEYFTEKQMLKGADANITTCAELAHICGVSLHTAASYAATHGGTGIWRDYITAAIKLDYDLSRRDVSMPKDLQRRHDQATAAVYLTENKEKSERYAKNRLPALRRKYEFTFDGLTIIVPKTGAEIIAEGKAMKHCVGGYADRHLLGKTTILFLRREEEPGKPFVTIEMNGEKLVQARGYMNDAGRKDTPQTRHPEFFATWLDWLQAGSPRLADGTPIIQKVDKEGKTA